MFPKTEYINGYVSGYARPLFGTKKLALLKLAKDMGMTISPSQIVEALRPIAGMVDKQGKLVPGAIAQIARAND